MATRTLEARFQHMSVNDDNKEKHESKVLDTANLIYSDKAKTSYRSKLHRLPPAI